LYLFLCDLDEYREGESIRPTGSHRLGAANLRGTGYVAHDFEWEHITCVALRSRAATKDYHDLAYVPLHRRAGADASRRSQNPR
jgi:hypothetical protein